MEDSKFKLDFVGIGFPRCGTTWISKCLAEHPEICFSEPKEPHFFDILLRQGKGVDSYKKYFTQCKKNTLYGEFTTTYFNDDEALRNILEYFPNIKIIVALRNPIDRSFSQYLYRKRKTGAHKNFSGVIENDEAQIISTSLYYKHLVRIFSIVPKENTLVVIHDDAKKDPQAFMQSIYKFLNVSDGYVPESLLKETNRTKDAQYKIPWIRWVLQGNRFKIKKSFVAPWLIPVLKSLGIKKLVQFVENANLKKGDHKEKEFIAREDKKALLSVLMSDIEKLERMLGRDLSTWKQ